MSKTARKVISVFSAFSIEEPYLTFDQLKKRTCLPHSTLYRYLHYLLTAGFLINKAEGIYSLGPAFLQLGRIAQSAYGVREAAVPFMEYLFNKLEGQTVSLWVPFGNLRLCLENREPKGGGVIFSCTPGKTGPLYAGATGKVLLAFMDESEARAIISNCLFQKITPRTVTSKSKLLEQLHEIRANGYCISISEVSEGAYALAAPILNSFGLVEASLAIAGPIEANKMDKVQGYVPILLELAKKLSYSMGYKPKP